MIPVHRLLTAAILAVALAACDRRVSERQPAPPAPGQPIVAVSSGAAPLDLSRDPAIRDIATSYTHLERITRHPVAVDAMFAYACAPAVAPTTTQSVAIHGPHAQTSVTIYMNAPAADAFAGRPIKHYPVGSVIVKEKTATSQAVHDGVGGMVKRAAGFDPARGDWEYFYFRDTAHIESGRITTCVQCHRTAAAKDYVFGDWALLAGDQ